MRYIAELLAAHETADEELRKLEETEPGAGRGKQADRVSAHRDHLARAFTVLYFGQFEQEVNRRYEDIRNRQRSRPLMQRLGWDHFFLNRRAEKVPFEARLAVVMDMADEDYGNIIYDFRIRHHFAHGGLTEAPAPARDPVRSSYAYLAELHP